ncbi:type II toxin-antitoxin system RelE/ParE family toxin [Haladaptatus sp. CMAA 1911]|uniref:type II toxin-antitoxin system RelE family toxin n=1 Tax=unclassified Haladaptatus TaxID=2622732 RepID=UPI003754BFDA
MPDDDAEYKFVMHKRADKDLSNLPKEADDRIQAKLKEMVTNPWRDLTDYDVEELKGAALDIYRTRIGGYRVIFVIEDAGEFYLVGILHVDKREGVYGNIQRLVDRAKDFFAN